MQTVVRMALLMGVFSVPAWGQTRLLRFPASNGQEVVFGYADQLYAVGPAGGVARRLTSSPGYAIFPHFSPDGKELAFTAQYDGNTEVYVMPAEGGEPKRITYTATLARDDLSDRMGPNNLVLGWSKTAFAQKGKPAVIFRSRMRSRHDFVGQLYAAPMDGDLPLQLPVPEGGSLSFFPDETRMAYNRVFREFRTWKDYRGGMADDIWILDFKTGKIEDITNHPAQDIIPMWGPDNRIYFLSDRDGRLNLFSYDLGSHETKQLTHFRKFDIKFPTLGPDGIVFEQAGLIWRFDLASQQAQAIPIEIHEDFAGARGGVTNVTPWITEARPAPDGERAVVIARGDLFTVPADHGVIRNLTNTSNAHERDASWSPDGKSIAYLSDATGEDELYVRPQWGGIARQLTEGEHTYAFRPVWSPDSKKLLWSDSGRSLRMIDVATKQTATVAQNRERTIDEYAWSPDSQWIAYTWRSIDQPSQIRLFEASTGRTIPATDGFAAAYHPNFSDDGRFLMFVSQRDYAPLYSEVEWDHVFVNTERVYLLALSRAARSPLAPRDDEVGVKPRPVREAGVSVHVEPEGLMDRVVALPIAPANYDRLRWAGDRIYYLRTQASPQGESSKDAESVLVAFDLKERKEVELGTCDRFEITPDGKRMLVKAGKEYGFLDLPIVKFELKDKLDFAGLEMDLNRRQEWKQIYWEAWRQMREFFFDPKLGGVDWQAEGDKYAELLPEVKNRYDLSYLIGELLGELHTGHTYVEGGDLPAAPRVPMGLLGAEFSRDPVTRFYRVDRILPGTDDPDLRSPLAEVGVNVREGDYILAIDGRSVTGLPNLFAALQGKAGRTVMLQVNAKPAWTGARTALVVPIASEIPLYYRHWVARNRAHVAERSGGRIGYIHIPDMGPGGLSEFARQYYAQLARAALIVDDRGNAGGNVSPMVIERLRRSFEMYGLNRESPPERSPPDAFAGPLALLINEYSASDGDLFAYRFRVDRLGPLIGRRTWGGAVGIGALNPFSDGGGVRRPRHAYYSLDGKAWVVEGHGVDPDLVVDNDPTQEFHGTDQQLDRAIDELLAKLAAAPPVTPGPPPYVDKRLPESAPGGG
ncbi:MAG TPA: S41 family peptidase [Opitutaceae bacterium]|jgi:tricorn protease